MAVSERTVKVQSVIARRSLASGKNVKYAYEVLEVSNIGGIVVHLGKAFSPGTSGAVQAYRTARIFAEQHLLKCLNV